MGCEAEHRRDIGMAPAIWLAGLLSGLVALPFAQPGNVTWEKVPWLLALSPGQLAGGLLLVAALQPINLLQRSVLLAIGGLTALVAGLVWHFAHLPPAAVAAQSGLLANVVLITLVTCFLGAGLVRRVPVTDHVVRYAVRLARATRGRDDAPEFVRKYVSWGAGPRASQFLVLGAKTRAVLRGRFAPGLEDVQAVAPSVLRHRIVTNFTAEAEGIRSDRIIADLLKTIPTE